MIWIQIFQHFTPHGVNFHSTYVLSKYNVKSWNKPPWSGVSHIEHHFNFILFFFVCHYRFLLHLTIAKKLLWCFECIRQYYKYTIDTLHWLSCIHIVPINVTFVFSVPLSLACKTIFVCVWTQILYLGWIVYIRNRFDVVDNTKKKHDLFQRKQNCNENEISKHEKIIIKIHQNDWKYICKYLNQTNGSRKMCSMNFDYVSVSIKEIQYIFQIGSSCELIATKCY